MKNAKAYAISDGGKRTLQFLEHAVWATTKEITASLQMPARTVNAIITNLMQGQFIYRDPLLHSAHYRITLKGRRALKAPDTAPPEPAAPRTPMTGPGHYVPDLHCVRPGADDALAIPSRMNDRLHHRDGRVTDLTGNAL